MSLPNEPSAWQVESSDAFVPVYYKGDLAGFFKKEYAHDIIKFLNEDEVLKKALKLACIDLVKETNGDSKEVSNLIKKYIKMSKRPKYGTRAIALLLTERQKALDLSSQEFAKFCDTFKLSPDALNNIYAGEAIEDNLLAPLSRILGITKEQLLEVRDGSKE
ncbi:hypothetical protein H6G33_06105 [Calothrix sp. FACHB-1219]|uniref:hypothetical protein n=1 Tax=unclassified Calothrix TaxID=2619626 RepID=UPI001688CC48|nr:MULTISPECIES: hypothetical protein [unclassified Calothrix]MBD2205195.1 hypothetical protein [Calothrix sp. FACHB-168]MBD2216601.1 hypothetical protein [Calothrix sp. FACHB-1219]